MSRECWLVATVKPPSAAATYAILLCLARLGVRAGEVVSLGLEDIDWEAGYLTVRGKGDRSAQLPYTSRCWKSDRSLSEKRTPAIEEQVRVLEGTRTSIQLQELTGGEHGCPTCVGTCRNPVSSKRCASVSAHPGHRDVTAGRVFG